MGMKRQGNGIQGSGSRGRGSERMDGEKRGKGEAGEKLIADSSKQC